MNKLDQWKDQTSDAILTFQMIVTMLALIERLTRIECDTSRDYSTKLKMLTALATILVRKHRVITAVENVSQICSQAICIMRYSNTTTQYECISCTVQIIQRDYFTFL